MTSQLLYGLVKLLMMLMPFLSMVLMMLALWDVVGKTTYTDLEVPQPGVAIGGKEAKNYLVSETKNSEQCPKELKSPEIGPEGENPMPNKIDWEHVV